MGDTTIISTDYDHMPDEAMRLSMDGMTLREALASLRVPNGRAEFGDIGGCRCDLSDGTQLVVALEAASDGGYLMSSQRIQRVSAYEHVRYYPWN